MDNDPRPNNPVSPPADPSFQPQPTQPVAPPQYGSPQTPYAPTPPPARQNKFQLPKNKKPLLLVAGLVVVALIGVLLFSLLGSSISQEDYRQAYTKSTDTESKLSAAYYSAQDLGSSSIKTQTQIQNAIDKAKSDLEAYKTAHKELDGQKALSDKDVKPLYKAYNEKYDKFIAKVSDYNDAASKLMPVTVECSNNLNSLSLTDKSSIPNAVSGLRACADKLKAIGSLKDADLQSLKAVMEETFVKYADLIERFGKVADSDYTTRSNLRNELFAIQDSTSDKSKDVQSNLEKHMNAVNPRDDLRKVTDKIFDKSMEQK
jgi:hypothetical protein